MVVSAGWWTGSLKTEMGQAYRDVGVAPLPVPESDGRRATLSTGFMLGVNTASEHPREAWEFLRWINTEKVSVKSAKKGATATRMSSCRWRSAPDRPRRGHADTPGRRQRSEPAPFLDALAYAVPEPNVAGAQQAKSLLRKNIEALWTGQQSVDESLRTIRRQVDQEVSRSW